MHLLPALPTPPDQDFVPFADDAIEQAIGRRFEQQVRAHGERTAIEWEGRRYTYVSLDAAANRLARTIITQRGPGSEPIALLFDHGGDALAAILAVLKAGKIYVVLDPAYPRERLEYMLADSGAALMVADTANLDDARQLCGSSIALIDFDGLDVELRSEALDTAPAPDAPAVIIYTSGSTGRPKGVLHTHRSLLADCRNVTNGYRAGPRDRWLLYSTLSFSNSVRTVYAALMNGGALYPFDVRRRGFAELTPFLADNAITIIRGLPTFFRNFMASLEASVRFPAVRLVAVGGESLLQADLAYFDRHFAPSCVLVHAFGPTECLSTCWSFIPHGTSIGDGKLPIGYAIRDKHVLLLDDMHRPVGDGDIGEIAVQSRFLAAGYWRDPEGTAAAFLPDPEGGDARIYRTGDYGRRTPEGMFVHLGRQDFQVKIRGYRVDTAEIENALRAHPGVRDAVVVGRTLDAGEQRLIAYYVIDAGPVTPAALRASLARKLPDYMIPSLFVALDALPKNPNGKTDRLRLPLPERRRRSGDPAVGAPASAVEANLAAIWADVLGLDEVGIDEAFVDLGGDSLQAAAIAARVVKRYEVEISAAALLESGTVGEMACVVAALLDDAQDNHARPEPRHKRSGTNA